MRVPQFVGGGRIAWTERPVPTPGPGQLLLRVGANALCGSERGQWIDGARVVPGHEAAGVVAAAGAETSTPVGTPGVAYLMDFCGTCLSCALGCTNQCLHKRGDLGFNRDGGYAPYELVSETVFFPVPEALPLDLATLLLDVMGTGGHAIGRARRLRADIESVLVTGAGPIGLGLLAMCRLLLGRDVAVYVSDIAPPRLRLAERLGGIPVSVEGRGLLEGLAACGRSEVDAAFDACGRAAPTPAASRTMPTRSPPSASRVDNRCRPGDDAPSSTRLSPSRRAPPRASSAATPPLRRRSCA